MVRMMIVVENVVKTCRTCGEPRPLSDYHKKAASKDGHQSRCKECAKKMASDWYYANLDRARSVKAESYLRNPEPAKQRNRAWVRENRDRANARNARWRAENPTKQAEYYRRMKEKDPERVKAIQRNNVLRRVARKKNADVRELSPKDIRRLNSGLCSVSGCPDTATQWDHIIPLARGGRHSIGNLQPLCPRHNQSKGSKTWYEFLRFVSSQPHYH